MTSLPRESLESLIRETLLQVLAEWGGRAPAPAGEAPASGARPVLALLTGGEGGWNALKLSLRVLAGRRPLHLVASEGFAARYGEPRALLAELDDLRLPLSDRPSLSQALALLDGACALAAPLMTRTLAAKISLGITDSAPSALLFQALTRGVPVIASLEELRPSAWTAPPALLQGPSSLPHLLESYAQRLTAWGVKWTRVENLATAVEEALIRLAPPAPPVALAASAPPSGGSPGPGGAFSAAPPAASARRFYVREDLRAMLDRGERRLDLSPYDVITPEAEEFAAAHGIEISRPGPRP